MENNEKITLTSEISIKNEINKNLIKKIFGNKTKIIEFLNFKGIQVKKNEQTEQIYSLVEEYWNYENDKNLIREMFKETDKYQKSQNAIQKMTEIIDKWKVKFPDQKFDWPFRAQSFDAYVAKINRSFKLSENEKDDILSMAVVMFRWMKEFNTYRNDYIESLIIENYNNVVPTLNHSKSVDFFIDGTMYDQKVSRSVGEKLIKEIGNNYIEIIKNNPRLVAKSLYQEQDEERFDADYRLYVVYLKNEVLTEGIKESILRTQFSKPLEIEFEYNHKITGKNEYKTKAIVLLIS